MARQDFVYIGLHKGLCKEIDKRIKSVVIYGKPKYSNRTEFVSNWVTFGLTNGDQEQKNKEVLVQ